MAGITNLHIGNGITAGSRVPSRLSIQSSLSLELTSLKTTKSYTSLRDILPSSSAINSPSSAASSVAIRNRLVKQAAWAYLQPMSASPSSDGPRFLRRFWLRLSSAVDDGGDSSCVGFLACHVVRAVDRLLALFHVPADIR